MRMWWRTVRGSLPVRRNAVAALVALLAIGCVSSGTFEEFRADQDRRAQAAQQSREVAERRVAELADRLSKLAAELRDVEGSASNDRARIGDLNKMLQLTAQDLANLQKYVERSLDR